MDNATINLSPEEVSRIWLLALLSGPAGPEENAWPNRIVAAALNYAHIRMQLREGVRIVESVGTWHAQMDLDGNLVIRGGVYPAG